MKKNIDDKYLDNIIINAARIADETATNKIKEPEHTIHFSDEHLEKMSEIFKRDRKRQSINKFISISKKAACILLAFVFLGGISILGVDAWRSKVINYVFDKNRPSTEFNFDPYPHDFYYDADIRLSYIPLGFELDLKQVEKDSLYYKFTVNDKHFSVLAKSTDNINVPQGKSEETEIKNYKAIYVSNKKSNAVIWSDGKLTYCITGNIEKTELLNTAESLVVIKEF